MDGDDDTVPEAKRGPRIPKRKLYAPGNTRPDGSYLVGKGRTPAHTRFREGDGRRRGRRPKGQRNFDTEFEAESRRLINLREAGETRRVSKIRATIIRTYDSALTKGDPRSASLVFSHASRIAEKRTSNARRLPVDDDEQLDDWLRQRMETIQSSEPAPEEQIDDHPAGLRSTEEPGDD